MSQKINRLCTRPLINAFLIAVTLTLAAPINSLQAGTKDGGGGGTVVCFNTPKALAKIRAQGGDLRDEDIFQIQSIEAYDLFQARLPRGLVNPTPTPLFEMHANETSLEYIERVAQRFDLTAPVISDMIRTGMDLLKKGDVIYAPSGVAQIDDAEISAEVDHSHCAIFTTANQHHNDYQLTLTLDSRLMNHPKHSAFSQAVLIQHEAIYAVGRLFKEHKSSRPTRELLSILLRKKIPFSIGELLQLYFDGLHFPTRTASHGSEIIKGEAYPDFSRRNAHKIITDIIYLKIERLRHYDTNILGNGRYDTDLNRCLQRGYQDAENCRNTPYYKSRDQWVREDLRKFWDEKKAKMPTSGAMDPDLIQKIESWLSNFEVGESVTDGINIFEYDLNVPHLAYQIVLKFRCYDSGNPLPAALD